MKKVFLTILVVLGLLIGALFAIPYFFKDRIVAEVKKAANEQVNAKVDFEDVSFSIFKNFPQLTIGLQSLSVMGIDEFEGVPLAQMESFDMSMNPWKLITDRSSITIRSITLEKPKLHIIVNESGKANYDIAKTSATDTEESTSDSQLHLKLTHYGIKDGALIYDDQQGDIYTRIDKIDHRGSGDFATSVFNLDTYTDIDDMTVRMTGINYLNKAHIELDAAWGIDLDNEKYTLQDNSLTINALELLAEGYIQMRGEDIAMDLTCEAPSANVKDILSLVPNAYTKDYSDVKANGEAGLKGHVKGVYNDASLPAFDLHVFAKNGAVQYPDLPLPIQNINTDIKINSPGGNDLDRMVVNVSNFDMNIDNEPFSARMLLKTPISNPDVDAAMKGHLDLANISRAFPMEGIEKVEGTIDADVAVKATMSQLENEQYDQVDMRGDLSARALHYAYADFPAMHIKELVMDFSPRHVSVPNFEGTLGRSDWKANGKIDNILAYIKPGTTMKGDFSVTSERFDAGELMNAYERSLDSDAPWASYLAEDTTTTTTATFDAFDFTMDIDAAEILYEDYTLTNTHAEGHFTPDRFEIGNFQTVINDDNDLQASGTIFNVYPFLFEDKMLEGEAFVKSKYFNLNEFMEEEETTADTVTYEAILIPANIDMVIQADMNEVIYDNLNMREVKGALLVKDQAVKLQNVNAKALGGSMSISGGYETKDTLHPHFDLDYAMRQIDIKETFETFNTFAILAPIGKFMTGKMSTDLKMDGFLGQDLMPDLSTINIDGLVETYNAFVKSFKPLQAVGNTLNVGFLENVKFDDFKNRFTVDQGTVTIKPFTTQVKNIPLQISGSHSLTNAMDYTINTTLPIEMLGQKASGQVNALIGKLSSQTSKLGINIDEVENLDVAINLGGSMNKPKVNINPLGADGGTPKEVIESLVDNTKQKAEEKINTLISENKEDGVNKLNEEIAKIQADFEARKAALLQEGDAAAARLREEGYAKADELVANAKGNFLKKKAAEVASKELKKQTDKKVEKLQETWKGKVDELDKQAEKQIEAVRKKYENQ